MKDSQSPFDLIERVVQALEESTTDNQVNPLAFFNHPLMANWLKDAKHGLDLIAD